MHWYPLCACYSVSEGYSKHLTFCGNHAARKAASTDSLTQVFHDYIPEIHDIFSLGFPYACVEEGEFVDFKLLPAWVGHHTAAKEMTISSARSSDGAFLTTFGDFLDTPKLVY